MRKPHGYAFTFEGMDQSLVLKERDTFTCSHCNKVVHVKPMCPPEDMGGYCTLCDSLVCKNCNYLRSLGKPCVPFKERIDKLDTHLERGGGMELYDYILDDLGNR